MTGMNFDECMATLALKTNMSQSDWIDFFAASPAQQAAIAKAYADAEWTKSQDVFAEVMAILNVLVMIAGAVSGIASATAAVALLRAL